jgi:CheY-like chemotaxis protein
VSVSTTHDLITTVPSVLWFILAVAVVFYLRRPLMTAAESLKSLKLPGGIEATFGERLKTAAAERSEALPKAERTRIVGRVRRNAEVLAGARVLWVDDAPAGNASERAALTAAGVTVETATSTDEAQDRLRRTMYHLVISDMRRGDDATAGLKLLEIVRTHNDWQPVVFYVGSVRPNDPVPVGASAITERPTRLIDAVIDALERVRS